MPQSREVRYAVNNSQPKIKSVKELIDKDPAQKFNIPLLLDELDGASFSGDKLTTSGTPTVDQLEAAVGSLANRVNLLIRALKNIGIVQ